MIQCDGKLEIHVPLMFTDDRPAVHYAHRCLSMAIEEHPQAKKLPKATGDPSIQLGPQDFAVFATREDAPSTLDDFLYSDTPQLSLHITSFTDATLVGLSWPHTLMDIMGQKALLQSWSLVLAGRESEVPPLLGAREDPVYTAAEASLEKREGYKLSPMWLRGASLLWFGLRMAWDSWWSQPAVTRTICLPKRSVVELRRQALAELTTEHREEADVFVSEGDALVAWATHAIASSSPRPRPVTALQVLNMRFRLASLVEPSGVFVQNMVVIGFTFLPTEVASGSIGPIALANRRHLNEQSTEPQVVAHVRELHQEYTSGRDPFFICGDPNAIPVAFTNWTKADVTKIVDFSPAVVHGKGIEGLRPNPPGFITFHHAESRFKSSASMNAFTITGKDSGDNYWITATLYPPVWAILEESLKKM